MRILQIASFCTAMVAVAVASSGAAHAVQPPWDFEGGLNGWTKSGTAFDSQPTLGNNIAVRRPGFALNAHGDRWIGTYESRPDEAPALGTTQGDAPQGKLWSNSFTVEHRYLSFLLGGGSSSATRVELLLQTSSLRDIMRARPSGLGRAGLAVTATSFLARGEGRRVKAEM